jgi:hypothetical protein
MELSARPALHASIAIVLAASGLLIAIRTRRRIEGTTLVGPWGWLVFALLALCGSELWITQASIPGSQTRMLRLAAACTSFLPLMSLLGAKRPQHKAWHFIVLSLWVILLLPVLEGLLLRPEKAPDLQGIRSAFVVGLIALGLINHLPTRYWLSALLVGIGQAVLLCEHVAWLTLLNPSPSGPAWLVGQTLIVLALITATVTRRRSKANMDESDRLWFDFRDQFGLLWGLRFSERINAASGLAGWPVELHWNGFRYRDGRSSIKQRSGDEFPKFQQAVDNLLRRFVSDEWIARRRVSARSS